MVLCARLVRHTSLLLATSAPSEHGGALRNGGLLIEARPPGNLSGPVDATHMLGARVVRTREGVHFLGWRRARLLKASRSGTAGPVYGASTNSCELTT